MRRTPRTLAFAPVIPGALLSLVVYGAMVRVATLYFLCTVSYPRIDGPPMDRSPGTALFVTMTLIHLGFGAALLGVWRRARTAPPGLRRAHRAGCVVGLLLLALLQWATLSGLGAMHALLDQAGR